MASRRVKNMGLAVLTFCTKRDHALDFLKLMISAKEMPNKHTDKERFAAASSCFVTGDLDLTLPVQTTAF